MAVPGVLTGYNRWSPSGDADKDQTKSQFPVENKAAASLEMVLGRAPPDSMPFPIPLTILGADGETASDNIVAASARAFDALSTTFVIAAVSHLVMNWRETVEVKMGNEVSEIKQDRPNLSVQELNKLARERILRRALNNYNTPSRPEKTAAVPQGGGGGADDDERQYDAPTKALKFEGITAVRAKTSLFVPFAKRFDPNWKKNLPLTADSHPEIWDALSGWLRLGDVCVGSNRPIDPPPLMVPQPDKSLWDSTWEAGIMEEYTPVIMSVALSCYWKDGKPGMVSFFVFFKNVPDVCSVDDEAAGCAVRQTSTGV